MPNNNLVDHAFVVVNSLYQLRKLLKNIVDQDAQRAMKRGYSPTSLGLGPLSQWIYVIDTHLAAQPVLSTSNPSLDAIRLYSSYILFLKSQLQSDRRFVSEIHLQWSLIWQEEGKDTWEAVLHSTQAIEDYLANQENSNDAIKTMINAMTVYFAMQSPRD